MITPRPVIKHGGLDDQPHEVLDGHDGPVEDARVLEPAYRDLDPYVVGRVDGVVETDVARKVSGLSGLDILFPFPGLAEDAVKEDAELTGAHDVFRRQLELFVRRDGLFA